MNGSVKKIALEELYPIIKEQLENGGTVGLPITGTSMLPLLVQGRDTVTLSSAENVKINDIIFYRRNNGAFVLHRIIGIDDKGYILCGDNQWVKEYGITDKNVIGVVTAIKHDGKVIGVDDKKYVKYCNLWLKLLPIRKQLIKILSVLRAIKRKMKKEAVS